MIHPAWGPFLFDTSVESRLESSTDSVFSDWVKGYTARYQVHVSAATVIERVRGYSLLWTRADALRKVQVEEARLAYTKRDVCVISVDSATAVVAGEIMGLLPDPPSAPRRSHRLIESRQERLSRWRFDAMIAATALVAGMPLIHNNPTDFESIRGVIDRYPDRFPKLGPLHLIRYNSLI